MDIKKIIESLKNKGFIVENDVCEKNLIHASNRYLTIRIKTKIHSLYIESHSPFDSTCDEIDGTIDARKFTTEEIIAIIEEDNEIVKAKIDGDDDNE